MWAFVALSCHSISLAYLCAVAVLLLPATRVARRDEGSRSILGANRRVLDIVTAAGGVARLMRGHPAQKASTLAQHRTWSILHWTIIRPIKKFLFLCGWYEILSVVLLKIRVYCHVTPCRLVTTYRCFRWLWCLRRSGGRRLRKYGASKRQLTSLLIDTKVIFQKTSIVNIYCVTFGLIR